MFFQSPTVDKAQVEISCQVIFHIIEIESAITYSARDPHDLIVKRAQLALSHAIGRIQWNDIDTGHALPDIASDVRVGLPS